MLLCLVHEHILSTVNTAHTVLQIVSIILLALRYIYQCQRLFSCIKIVGPFLVDSHVTHALIIHSEAPANGHALNARCGVGILFSCIKIFCSHVTRALVMHSEHR